MKKRNHTREETVYSGKKKEDEGRKERERAVKVATRERMRRPVLFYLLRITY
jgi:hypothetical protein